MFEQYHDLIRTVYNAMVADSRGGRDKEWGCGIRPNLTPYKLHRGRRNCIVTHECSGSLGAIHTHPRSVAVPPPPSLADLISHCEGARIHGRDGYVSITVAWDPQANDELAVWVLEGEPSMALHRAEMLIATYEPEARRAESCPFGNVAYALYMDVFTTACREVGVICHEFNIPIEVG